MKSSYPSHIGLRYLAKLAGIGGVAVVIFSLLINMLMLTGPLFMLQVYDRVLASGSIPTLVVLFALLVVLYVLYGILDFIRSRIMLQLANKLDMTLRNEAFQAIGDHATKGNPEVRTLPLSDLNKVRQFLASQGPFGFLDAPWTPVYLAVIYLLHPVLGLASLGAEIILVIVAVLNNYFTSQAASRAGAKSAKAGAGIEEFRNNAEVTIALGMAPAVRDRWVSVHDGALDEYASASNTSGLLGSVSKSLRLIFQSAILGLGAYLAIQLEITPGTMIAGSILMSRALAPLDQLIANWQNYLAYRQSRQRLSSVLSQRPPSRNDFHLPRPEGKLQVKGLGYRLPKLAKPILSNINFALQPGDGLAIIGPTGSGKTSLARILVGVSGEYAGNVEIDGAEISQYPLDDFGQFIGYMPQEVHLYEGTVAENVARMNKNADPEKVVEAARLANVHELIKGLPDGYETMLLDGGKNLSSGQRQRIGLARAVYGNPALVVLDEPNANLDPDGETAIVEALEGMRAEGVTVIVVAHHPRVIAALNKVLALKDGLQLAFGPRDEVMAKIMRPPQGQRPQPANNGASAQANPNPFSTVLTGKKTAGF